ncbi:MAG: hypothetical protein ACE5GX_06850 [Thermoanaerobaculia bacterium]
MRARNVVLFVLFLVAAPIAALALDTEPKPVSPGSSLRIGLIGDTCPSFSWGGVTGAASYEIAAYSIEGDREPGAEVLRHRVPGSALSWTPGLDRCLRPRVSYAWAVRAVDQHGSAGEWSAASFFEIAAEPTPDEVRRALGVLSSYLESIGAGVEVPKSIPSPQDGPDLQAPAVAAAIGTEGDPGPRALAVPASTALTAEGSPTTGVVFGVHGISKSTGGGSVGVAGESTAASGDTTGVYGQVASAAGAAGVFDNTASGDILRGLAAGVEVLTVEGTGDVTATSFSGDGSGLTSVNAGSADDLACVTCVSASELDFSAANLNAAGTVAADWVNTAFPWADNEVSDTLTIGAAGSVADGALSANVSLLGQTIESAEITDGTVTATDIADGAGSGLDADSVDSIDSAAFLQKTELDTEAELEAQVGASLVNSTETALKATALAVDGTNCPAGQWASGVDDSGNAQGCTADAAGIDHGFATGNTRVGSGALAANTTGSSNSAHGDKALYSNSEGSDNTAIGREALLYNTTGYSNTAAGRDALRANTTGYNNTAAGVAALTANAGGSYNTAVGESALSTNTTGHRNTAIGRVALRDNITGYSNVAVGESALFSNTSGDKNVAQGQFALRYNTSGSRNTAVGPHAGTNATIGSDNIFVGSGAEGVATEANTIRIGGTTVGAAPGQQNRTFINGISGITPAGGTEVVVIDGNGQLGSTSSVADGALSANVAHLNVAETIAADWVNTAFPWADNEVSDTLTVGAAGSVDDGALGANVSLLGQTIESAEITDGTVTATDIADGAGSGLDADTLDTFQAAAFVQASGDSMTGSLDMGGNQLTEVSGITRTGANNLDLTSGQDINLNATSGDINLNASSTTINLNASTTIAGNLGVSVDDANNNTVDTVLDLTHNTTGVPGAGIGTAIDFQAEDTSGGADDMARIEAVFTNATDTSEESELHFLTRTGGGALSQTASLDGAGTLTATAFSGDGSALTSVNPAAHAHSGADITTGTVAEARIDDLIARDAEVTAAIAAAAHVNRAGDTMTGTLTLTPGAGNALEVNADINLASGNLLKGGTLFLHDNGTSNTGLGLGPLSSNTTGFDNVAVGDGAMQANTEGAYNTAVGQDAMRENTTGSENTALGETALRSNVTGSYNTAAGINALHDNYSGSQNTAVGSAALFSNTTGLSNTAVGRDALRANTVSNNTAVGSYALAANTLGPYNTAVGWRALASNTTNHANTAVGFEALRYNYGGGIVNTAVGHRALKANTSGFGNTSLGADTMNLNTTGDGNTAAGHNALTKNTTGHYNTGIGRRALYTLSTGDRNVALGHRAGYSTTGSDNILIGNEGVGAEANTIRIGGTAVGTGAGEQNRAFINGIRDVTPAGATELVVIDGSGQLGSTAGGTGSGIDADTIDGLEAGAFVLKGGDVMSGSLGLGGNSLTEVSQISRTGFSNDLTLATQRDLVLNVTGDIRTSADILFDQVSGNDLVDVKSISRTGAANDLTLSSERDINLNATSGDINLNASSTTINLNASTTIAGNLGVSVDDANNNTVDTVLDLTHNTTGVPGAGIGTAIDFQAEDTSGGADDMARIEAVFTNATDTSEESELHFLTRTGGGALTQTASLDGAGTLTATAFSGDGSALTNVNPAAHVHSGADITTGTVAEPRIDDLIARDAEVTAAITGAGHVDKAGDTMSGDLGLGGNDINDLGVVRKGGSLFIHAPLTSNTSVGGSALGSITGGQRNVAFGDNALRSAIMGFDNAGLGHRALYSNLGGSRNTAVGSRALQSNTSSDNTAAGARALESNTTGSSNTAAGAYALYKNVDGLLNTALGVSSLKENTSGSRNVAVGSGTLDANTTGSFNIAIGTYALSDNTTGSKNTAVGISALNYSTVGENTAVGYQALRGNTTGAHNSAHGTEALRDNTTGGGNTAIGWRSLASNTTAGNNTATGNQALGANTIGVLNTAMGQGALYMNTTGSRNSAFGQTALRLNNTASNNTGVGYGALNSNVAGAGNVAVGYKSGFNALGSDNIFVGSGVVGAGADANTIRIGGTVVGAGTGQQNRTFINGIRGVSVTGGQTVLIDSNGQLGSSAGGASSGIDADTVDGFHAAATAAANTLLALDGSSQLNLPANGLVAGTDQLVLSGGNVGIGNIAPIGPLHVEGLSTQVTIEDSASLTDRHILQLGIHSGEAFIAANHIPVAPTSLGMKLQVRNSGVGLDAVKILSDGKVGIGDTSPTHKLDVAGDVTVGSETSTLDNGGFSLDGDDLFVAGDAGVEGTIYTDAGVTVGASTTFADGLITQSTDSSGLAVNVAGGDAAGEDFTLTANNISVSAAGAVAAASFSGVGSGLTGVAASTAAALASAGSSCIAGQFATGVDASGNAVGCAVPGDANHSFATDNTKVGQSALAAVTTGFNNTATGSKALRDSTTGSNNTAAGFRSLYTNTLGNTNSSFGSDAMFANTDGDFNTAAGSSALRANTLGNRNTAVGMHALYSNTTASHSTAVGNEALRSSTAGPNTAVGSGALRANTTGTKNTATGYRALYKNTTGYNNTANGYHALRENTTGSYNTAFGYWAMRDNTLGSINSAFGHKALMFNTEGIRSTALGHGALYSNTTGNKNTAAGFLALRDNLTGSYNAAGGHYALRSNSTGSRNTALGYRAGFSATTGSDNIFLGSGAEGVATEANTIRIGGTAVGTAAGQQNRAFINGIRGVSVTGGQTVVIDASGQLGSTAGGGGSGVAADTVDGIHAAAAATANTLLALDASSKLPASITGDADTVDGKHAADLVDKSGDVMTGTLTLSPASGDALVTTAGNVGIGTASPQKTLHLRASGASSGVIFHQDAVVSPITGPFLSIETDMFSAGSGIFSVIDRRMQSVASFTPTVRIENSNVLTVGSNPLLEVAAAGTNRLLVRQDGRVGIGAASPATTLEVSSVMRLTPTDAPGTCGASLEGSMYYDASMNEPCFCDGTSWIQFDTGGACV